MLEDYKITIQGTNFYLSIPAHVSLHELTKQRKRTLRRYTSITHMVLSQLICS